MYCINCAASLVDIGQASSPREATLFHEVASEATLLWQPSAEPPGGARTLDVIAICWTRLVRVGCEFNQLVVLGVCTSAKWFNIVWMWLQPLVT